MHKHIIMIPLCLALALPPAAVITAGPSLAAATTCWRVVDAPDGTDDGSEMETLCVDANRKASFGPTSMFGDVTKCGTVALGGEAKMTFTVNLSACDGDLPNHSIACQPIQAGKARCALSWTDGSEDRPVLLVPTSN